MMMDGVMALLLINNICLEKNRKKLIKKNGRILKVTQIRSLFLFR